MADLTKMVGLSAGEAQDQRVETMILEPTAASQSQVKFLLPQQGLLSSDVFLTFKMTGGAATQDIPLFAGATGLIRRASIYYQNELLQETDQLPHLLQLKTFMVDQDVRNQTFQCKWGHFSGLKVDESAAGKKGMYSLDATNEYGIMPNGTVGLKIDTAVPGGTDINKHDSWRLSTNAADTPEWTIPLKLVFPWLSQTSLALGLLNGRVSIVFDLNDDLPGLRTVVNKASNIGVPWNPGNLLDTTSIRLSLDLIYYDDQPGKRSPMDAIQSALAKGLEMTYTDYVHVEEFIPGTGAAAPAAPIVRDKTIRLGLDHQIVRNILMAMPPQADYTDLATGISNPILGDYSSQASQGETELQVKINNQNLFVNALDMDAKIYNELSQVFNTPLKANVGATSCVGQVTGANLNFDPNQTAFPTDKFILGHQEGGFAVAAPHKTLSGSLGYMGVNLSRTYDNVLGAGTSIGKSPVEINLKYTLTPQNGQQNTRVLTWSECERVMMVKNGTIYVSGS